MQPIVLALIAVAMACRQGSPPPSAPRLARELSVPAAPGSGEPNLAAGPDGRAWLSWIEPAGEHRHRLMLSQRAAGGDWSAAQTIAEGDDWVVNWADFPSVAVDPDGSTLFAHWLARGAAGGHGYGVRVAVSRDGGRTWSPPVVPHRDHADAEHGFVSFVPWPGGAMGLVWLDGRQPDAMRLMATTIDARARLSAETVLDERVCDCCQTAAVRAGEDVLVAYRDRSPDEVRDISVLRSTGTGWTPPRTVGSDRWQIQGCPVNGPALAARGRTAVLAWFTAPGDAPRVNAAFSSDGGATFGPPLRVDDGRPAGRVDVVLLDDGAALVSWLESAGEPAAVRVRRVRPDGGRSAALTVAGSSAARSTGFPRMERCGGEVVLAWRDAADPPRVRSAIVNP